MILIALGAGLIVGGIIGVLVTAVAIIDSSGD